MNKLRSLATIASLLAALPMVNAQSVTGQMYGVVIDSTGAVISGASVKLINDNSQAVISYETSANGSFTFIGLFPATYNLKISHAGFKSYEQKNIHGRTLRRMNGGFVGSHRHIAPFLCRHWPRAATPRRRGGFSVLQPSLIID